MASTPLPDQTSSAASISEPQISVKRPIAAVSDAVETENRRKDPKVSRACDICKAKKIRCNGSLPCRNCTRRKVTCAYAAKYARGRPPTPPTSTMEQESSSTREPDVSIENTTSQSWGLMRAHSNETTNENSTDVLSRVSPELEIEGQYFDPTSGLTFLHRAWRKVFTQKEYTVSHGSNETDKDQLLTSAGDQPFCVDNNALTSRFIPDATAARILLAFYFDTCVVTYRMLHRQTTEEWMERFLKDREQNQPLAHSLGHAKCAIILTILAIATFRNNNINRSMSAENEITALRRSDQLFCTSMNLTDMEMGFPRLESIQARLIQALYLLQTSRMNKGSYTFGTAFHITLSLGMHRRRDQKRNVPFKIYQSDYINSQCCKRTFWVAYTIDKYLSVVFGRPRLYQDEDIDQDFPDSVNDEDMTPQGPSVSEDSGDCLVDALISHAKIARIIGKISREVYSVGYVPNHERVTAAHRLGRELHQWRANLPFHLGPVKPSTLVPSFRRQAIALQLAYSHAIMHANRPFLLGNENADRVAECIAAAKAGLELVDKMASDSTLFHSFWWTHYVTFCALTVVYVWEIQKGRRDLYRNDYQSYTKLFDLAENCRSHLMRATTGSSPNRRYNIILEELRLEAQKQQAIRENATDVYHGMQSAEDISNTDPRLSFNTSEIPGSLAAEYVSPDASLYQMPNMFDAWQFTDWLTLDSSAFLSFADPNAVSPSRLPT